MNIFRYIHLVFTNLFKNLHILGRYDLSNFEQEYTNFSNKLKRITLSNYAEHNKLFRDQFIEELSYINQNFEIDAIPYPCVKKIPPVICNYDKERKLPYILHSGKKIFFPKKWSKEKCESCYKYYIEKENIIGGNHTVKAPHQYITNDFQIEQNDILLDIGCAEALLALDVIEKVKKAYMFEYDSQWFAPLKATFAPYKEKICFIPKLVAEKDSISTISLSSLFKNFSEESFFVKMDIEGAEKRVLIGCKDFFNSNNKIKIACCTYHRKNDEIDIPKILDNYGYEYSFSDGYMLFYSDSNFTPPFFRKGLVRARKKTKRQPQ